MPLYLDQPVQVWYSFDVPINVAVKNFATGFLSRATGSSLGLDLAKVRGTQPTLLTMLCMLCGILHWYGSKNSPTGSHTARR